MGSDVNKYFLTGTLSITPTDDLNVERQFCVYVGARVFYASQSIALLLTAISHESGLVGILEQMNRDSVERAYTAEEIRAVIENRLIPMELVSVDEKLSTLIPSKKQPYLFFARTLLNENMVNALCRPFVGLFSKVGVLVSLSFCGVLLSLWFNNLIASGYSLKSAMLHFDMSLGESMMLYGVLFCCFLFHEIGHAAASKKFGARPAEIGVGLYLIFPALFCNVTDAWRLPRLARVVVNLGGVYFQLIATSVLIAFQLYSRNDVLTLAIASSLVAMLATLNPLFRFDGYWVYSDFFRIPNLRESAQKWKLEMSAHLVRSVSGKGATRTTFVASSWPLKIYAVTSTIFFAWFAATVLVSTWGTVVSVPQLLRIAATKLEQDSSIETMTNIATTSFVYVIYILACGFSFWYLVNAALRGMRKFGQLYSTASASAE